MAAGCYESVRSWGFGAAGAERGSSQAKLAPGSRDRPGEGGIQCLSLPGFPTWLKFRLVKGPQDSRDHV